MGPGLRLFTLHYKLFQLSCSINGTEVINVSCWLDYRCMTIVYKNVQVCIYKYKYYHYNCYTYTCTHPDCCGSAGGPWLHVCEDGQSD